MNYRKLITPRWWRQGMGGRVPEALASYRQLERARHHYRARRRDVLTRYLTLRRRRFSLQEIMLWGLLDPALPEDHLAQYISKQRFLQVQARNSPVGHAALLEDKEVFYRHCESLGVPVPRVIAFLSRGVARAPHSVSPLSGEDLRTILREHDGEELILKPVDGVYGDGIRVFKVSGEHLMEADNALTVKMLIKGLDTDRRYALQRRLFNHQDLRTWTGLKTLQTLRIATGLPDGPTERAQLLTVSWRSVVTNTPNDNFNYGRTGNLRIEVDPETGTMRRAIRAAPSGIGVTEVTCHPCTGQNLVGHRFPAWAETRRVISESAALFYPIRLVGWDVAITDRGPVIVEGNYWFDPDNAWGNLANAVSDYLS